jgi:hypothetical protein
VDHIFIPELQSGSPAYGLWGFPRIQHGQDLLIRPSSLPTPVHRATHFEDALDALRGEMLTSSDELRDLTEERQIVSLRAAKRKALEERKDPVLEILQLRNLEVVHAIWPAPNRSRTEDGPEVVQYLRAYLRNVERETDSPWHVPIALSTDWDVEASFSIDEPRDVVTYVLGDAIQPRWMREPFLLIVRTGRIVTAHVDTLSRTTDMNEYRRILGVSSK